MDKEALLKEILELPEETQTVEFKRLNGKKVVSKITETIVAMSNTDGGTIILGVDDPEKTTLKGFDRIFGIEEDKTLYDEIFHNIKKITPHINGINPIEINFSESKTIIILKIPKATESFYAIENNVYIRLRKSNKKLSPQEIIKFSYAKGFEKADKELVDVDFELLDTPYYHGWRSNRKISNGDLKEILFQTGLAKKNEDGVLKPTRAAVLLFAQYPTNIIDTKCAIRILQHKGTIETYKDVPNLLEVPKTIDGPIINVIKNAQDYILNILKVGISIQSGFVNKYKIPERAIKEAITNAVIHRDYHIKRDIEIRLFEDRIEVLSPGLFPYNITKTNIGRVRSDGHRNDLLVKHLRDFPEPPNLDLNEGVRAMRSEMQSGNLYPPIFFTYPIYEDSVNVVLLNESRPSEWEKVREYLEVNKHIDNKIARSLTGESQTYRMSRLFKKWVEQGVLEKIESPKGPKETRYRLPNLGELD